MPLNDYIRGLKRMASKKGKTSLPKKMKTGFDDGSDLATVAPTGAAPSLSVTAPIATAPTGAAPTGAISTRLAPIQAPQRTKILTAAPAHTSCASNSTNAENNVTRPELKRVRKKTLEGSPKRKNTLRDRSNVISPKPKRATRKLLNSDREGTARDHTDQEGTARNQNQVPSKQGKKVATRSSGIAKDGLKRNSSKIMPDKTKTICVVERLDESPEELTVEMLVTSETRTLPDVVTTDMLTTSTLDQLSNVNLSTSKFDADDLSTSKSDDDPFCLTYADDIVRYWLTLEKRFSLSSDFVDDNPEVDYTSRATLIDWLIQVQDHLGLLAETLHLCVSMIDRYLSTKTIRIYHIQLLGITCLFIACKYEERSPSPIKHLIYLTDNTYTYEEVIAMEVKILRVLAFQVFAPTAINFVPWLIRSVVVQDAEMISKKIESMVHYILDLTTSDGAFTSILPSIRASAAVALGGKLFFEAHMPTVCSRMKLLNIKVSLEQYENLFNFHAGSWRNISSYDIEPCMSRMARLLLRAPQSALQGARKKYSSVEQHDAISMDPIFTTSEILRQLSSQYS